ncbi:MAG: hypothetical protein A2Z08_06070 [Deltaproteobacteria bacterium RBG_16_54_11]|nr:MAG: hypothetical protein A2Z08_06070 [Deltaproteobacteria bacterium RBG_16_54_11]
MRIYPKCILALSLLMLPLLFSACSQVVYPRGSIPVAMDKVGPISTNKVISLVNAQTESKLTLVAVQGSNKFFADFKQWSDFIVVQLGTELEKRGVRVKPESDYVFKVSVPNLRFFWGAWSIRCIVNVQVERKDGKWAKTYEGNNAGQNINRAIDGAVHRAVAAIIGDPDFQRALSE